MKKPKCTYVFYRGESLQFVGTLDECAAHFGITAKSVRWHASPTARRRANEGLDNKQLYAEKVDNTDDKEITAQKATAQA